MERDRRTFLTLSREGPSPADLHGDNCIISPESCLLACVCVREAKGKDAVSWQHARLKTRVTKWGTATALECRFEVGFGLYRYNHVPFIKRTEKEQKKRREIKTSFITNLTDMQKSVSKNVHPTMTCPLWHHNWLRLYPQNTVVTPTLMLASIFQDPPVFSCFKLCPTRLWGGGRKQ